MSLEPVPQADEMVQMTLVKAIILLVCRADGVIGWYAQEILIGKAVGITTVIYIDKICCICSLWCYLGR